MSFLSFDRSDHDWSQLEALIVVHVENAPKPHILEWLAGLLGLAANLAVVHLASAGLVYIPLCGVPLGRM